MVVGWGTVIFIDEIDAICGKRSEGQQDSTLRMQTEFLTCMTGTCAAVVPIFFCYLLSRSLTLPRFQTSPRPKGCSSWPRPTGS